MRTPNMLSPSRKAGQAVLDQVTQIVTGAIIDCEIEYNEDAGTIIINEWHSDCDPPFYVVPVREAIKFAKWLAQTRVQQQRQAQRVSEMLFMPEDKARVRAANKKRNEKYPEAAALIRGEDSKSK